MNEPRQLHVYSHSIGDPETSSLAAIAASVPAGSRVLDVGCGSGTLGAYLVSVKQCRVDGITYNPEEAELARATYRSVTVLDLDRDVLDLPDASYDVVVCADVLEHLRQPQRVLAAAQGWLAEQGVLLVSVPNVAYAGLVGSLLLGHFRYGPEGLLDETHVRFFTRESLLSLLEEQGWRATSVQPIRRDFHESEFSRELSDLPPAVQRYLFSRSDSAAYQFVSAAVRQRAGEADAPTSLCLPAGERLRFAAALYYRGHEDYCEQDKVTAAGLVGEACQALRFVLPAGAGIGGLRLDPADRPGLVHLHGIVCFGADGREIYRAEWGAAAVERMRCHQILVSGALYPASGALLLLTGDDPWIELPVPAEVLAGLSGGTVEIRLGWPFSADYQALCSRLGELELELGRENDKLLAGLMEKDREMQLLTARIASLVAVESELEHSRANERARIAELRQARADLAGLQEHVGRLESLLIFRLTRPLAKLAARLRTGKGNAQRLSPPPQPEVLPAQPVDVIVPVYRGLEETRDCLESVLRAPVKAAYRLVVINDCSPEHEVTAYLRSLAAADKRVLLVENEENLGFVGTVNRGMALHADCDVLLLNSDTVVANDWLDRLQNAAYAASRIGSVTPFSNNATICSFPRFCASNELPDGYDVAALDRMFADRLAGRSVEIPTGVGFCMYIRRDCLNETGLFDVENFGKGYGEENDFCVRANGRNWRHLLAMDAFVYHAGGISFGESKSPREQRAMELLRKLHPQYEPAVMKHVAEDPARDGRLAVQLACLQESALPLVLAVTHARGGGTERHVQELAGVLRGQANFLSMRPGDRGDVVLNLGASADDPCLYFRLPDDVGPMLELLRSLGVDLIHYHHLLGLPEAVWRLPQWLGIDYDFTVHDFYPLCPQITLTGKDNGYCGEAGERQCASCLAELPAPGKVDIQTWRGNYRGFLAGARYVLAPSVDAARRIGHYFEGVNALCVPHKDVEGMQLPHPSSQTFEDGRPLKICVIGALSPIKGADVLEEVAREAARRKLPLDFHLFGYAYRSLRGRPKASLTTYGAYEEADLPELLRWLKPDLVWFPALWPETYSYTLSAALAEGLPIVAPDLGAFPERLQGRAWTWMVPWRRDPGEWAEFFVALREQNFLPGVAPMLPAGVVAPPTTGTFDYRRDYLPLRLRRGPETTPSPSEIVAAHSRRNLQGGQRLFSACKVRLLTLLARGRSWPLLRGLARRIPLRWQTRLKTALMR